ncbi:MAG: aldo/keto reductase [Granulosicoccaceae bacterium]
MQYRTLGRTDIKVSALCLGSMTWSTQNTTAEGHAQIDRALDAGINFIDTAEMYPVNPIGAETCGNTEKVIGEWFAKTGRRSDIVLASKITGDNPGQFVRDGEGINADSLIRACEGSLKRLQTDVIDVYQLHWPERGSYHFRQNWRYNPASPDKAATLAHMEAVLEAADKLIRDGKIRAMGLSNDSAWGTAQWLRLSEEKNLPRMHTIQNEYSLMCRLFDTDLAELCAYEDLGLLAYSPLATGLLTGKYLDGACPAGSRKSLNADLNKRCTPRTDAAVQAYVDIAHTHGLTPVQLSLAWARSRPFMASVIFGCTTQAQLEDALSSADISLSDEIIEQIELAHKSPSDAILTLLLPVPNPS